MRRRLLAAFAALVLLVAGTPGAPGLRPRRGRPCPGRRPHRRRCWWSTQLDPRGHAGRGAGRPGDAPRPCRRRPRVDGPGHRPRRPGRPGRHRRPPARGAAARRPLRAARRPAGAGHRRGARRACRRSASCSSRSGRSVAGWPPATPSASYVSLKLQDGTRQTARRPARRAGHPGAGRPGGARPRTTSSETASAGTPAPSASLMVTLAVTAAQDAETVVFGIEHGTLWLSLEPDGADTSGTERHRPGQHLRKGLRMSRVVLAGADEDLILRVKQADRRRRPRPAAGPPARRPRPAVRAAASTASCPTSCSSGPHAPDAEVLTLAARLDVQSPGHRRRPHGRAVAGDVAGRDARRASATCCRPSADVAEIRAAVERAGQAAAGRRRVLRPVDETERYTGRVITIASPKGGVGKTTVSTNLAIGLTAARAAVDRAGRPRRPVRRRAPRRWAWCPSTRCPTPSAARPARTRWSSRPSSPSTRAGSTPSAERSRRPPATRSRGEDVTRLLASLAREFRYVVVDTAPGLSEQTLAALDRATDVVMLTSMDVPGVRGLRKELDVLRELCMIPAGRHVVMNFADPKGGLSVRDVETTIGTGVDVVLPRSKARAGVDQPGRPAAAERQPARPDGQGAAAGWCPASRPPR